MAPVGGSEGDAGPLADRLARIERNEAIARRYLDRTADSHDPVYELPPVEFKWSRKEPTLLPAGVATCPAEARLLEEVGGGVYGELSVVTKTRGRCRLLAGHDGPHIAQAKRVGQSWQVWTWATGPSDRPVGRRR